MCTREYSRYKCPRCAIAYCGLDCYRAHGERCTEGFYKEQAERELRATRASESERADMADKLRRFEAEYGEWDGDALGLVEGLVDGDALGEIDGDALGLALGEMLGELLGLAEGDALGEADGLSLGAIVGLFVGSGQHAR